MLITTPFHPAYVTADRIARAKNLELLLTAGIGSDHVDLAAAAAAGLTVAEVTGSNTVSVAEDQLMRVLVLTRNFLPGHRQAVGGGWDVAAVAHRAYDLEGKTVGTVGRPDRPPAAAAPQALQLQAALPRQAPHRPGAGGGDRRPVRGGPRRHAAQVRRRRDQHAAHRENKVVRQTDRPTRTEQSNAHAASMATAPPSLFGSH